MPNLIRANNPLETGFLGDYMWVSSPPNSGSGDVHIACADTRGLYGAVEEDVYSATFASSLAGA